MRLFNLLAYFEDCGIFACLENMSYVDRFEITPNESVKD